MFTSQTYSDYSESKRSLFTFAQGYCHQLRVMIDSSVVLLLSVNADSVQTYTIFISTKTADLYVATESNQERTSRNHCHSNAYAISVIKR